MTRHVSRRAGPLLAAILLAAASAARAQYGPPPGYGPGNWTAGQETLGPRVFDISAFAGYQLNGDVGTNGGNLDIGDAPAFGAALDYRLNRVGSLELAWFYDSPDARFASINTLYPSSKTFTVHTHFFQIGGMTVQPMGRLEPFIGLTLGAALLVPEQIELTTGGTLNANDTWRFATTAMLGTKIWMTPNVGVRLEARMLVPIVFNSGGFYAGTGGSGLYASGGVPSLQFAFTGGLVFGK